MGSIAELSNFDKHVHYSLLCLDSHFQRMSYFGEEFGFHASLDSNDIELWTLL
jgi:hypothetical protein